MARNEKFAALQKEAMMRLVSSLVKDFKKKKNLKIQNQILKYHKN